MTMLGITIKNPSTIIRIVPGIVTPLAVLATLNTPPNAIKSTQSAKTGPRILRRIRFSPLIVLINKLPIKIPIAEPVYRYPIGALPRCSVFVMTKGMPTVTLVKLKFKTTPTMMTPLTNGRVLT